MYVGNEWCKRAVVGTHGTLTTPTAFVSAFLTGYIESACVTPFEAVKVRMQVKENMSRYGSSLQCARSMAAQEGLGSLYSGFWATCGRNCVFNSFYFGSIFFVKENLLTPPTDVASQVQQSLLTGLVGGNVATMFKMPFDIVKSRMQSQVPDAVTGELEYKSVTHAFRRIVREEGWRALYKGTMVTALRISLGFPVSLVAWDLTVWGMRGWNDEEEQRREKEQREEKIWRRRRRRRQEEEEEGNVKDARGAV